MRLVKPKLILWRFTTNRNCSSSQKFDASLQNGDNLIESKYKLEDYCETNNGC